MGEGCAPCSNRRLAQHGGSRHSPAPIADVAWTVPEDALNLLGGHPAAEPSLRVLLGSFDERLPKALVESDRTVAIRLGKLLPTITHRTEGSGPPVAAPRPGRRSVDWRRVPRGVSHEVTHNVTVAVAARVADFAHAPKAGRDLDCLAALGLVLFGEGLGEALLREGHVGHGQDHPWLWRARPRRDGRSPEQGQEEGRVASCDGSATVARASGVVAECAPATPCVRVPERTKASQLIP